MLVDDLAYAFLQGGFKQDILWLALHHSTVEQGDELFPLQPEMGLSLVQDFLGVQGTHVRRVRR